MLRTGSKRIMAVFFLLKSLAFAGQQEVNMSLNITYPGASQRIIGNQQVIDLGFLEDGASYEGGNRIHVGTVSVSISQTKTQEDSDGCFLENLALETVNLQNLRNYSNRISTSDRVYVGTTSGTIMLTEEGVKNIVAEGDVDESNGMLFFVDQSCIGLYDSFAGKAVTRLSYDFELYAEIPTVSKGNVVGSFAEDRGVQLSLRGIVLNQIQGSLRNGSNSLKRRAK